MSDVSEIRLWLWARPLLSEKRRGTPPSRLLSLPVKRAEARWSMRELEGETAVLKEDAA